jgi:hypothetical protein
MRNRYLCRHRKAFLEALVIVAVVLQVFLFSGAARAEQAAPAPDRGRPAAMGQMHRRAAPEAGAETAKCAMHEANAADVAALRTLLVAAQGANDIAVLREAVDAALRHLDRMAAGAAGCAEKMQQREAASAPATPAPAAPSPHVH